MDPALLRSLTDDLLDAAVFVLTPSGDPYVDDQRTAPPAMQYVAHGLNFAWDCELVAASIVAVRMERQAGHGCAVIPVATLAVTLLRCYPKAGDGGDNVPSSDEINAAARVLAVDAGALAGGLVDAWADGSLFAAVPCSAVTIIPGIEPLGPAGGLAGWRVTLEVRL